ncbi:hypothetical protein DEU56DRAFT_512383 [Suillus clintonianus]|uniref:uncharacterized protein n=1 Tax=Suillus clintonianus TaxID=1904413 RepID=UPI001B86AEA4|nr:uncharacterized protein DEU56DRAFT_512383 [Suillus clintonianus]KAG2152717.1 hypothetical protein DEU56DRAFT_512383 [Suillus clintonianus]
MWIQVEVPSTIDGTRTTPFLSNEIGWQIHYAHATLCVGLRVYMHVYACARVTMRTPGLGISCSPCEVPVEDGIRYLAFQVAFCNPRARLGVAETRVESSFGDGRPYCTPTLLNSIVLRSEVRSGGESVNFFPTCPSHLQGGESGLTSSLISDLNY